MQEFTFTVDKIYDGLSVGDFLKRSAGISAVILQKIKFGNIRINENVVRTVDKVKTDNHVKITLPKEEPNPFAKPIFTQLDIVYEDEYLIAVNKPIKMLTHNSKGRGDYTLENALCGYYHPKPFVMRAINRLDKDTSGIVIVAKDTLTASLLGEQMKNGDFIKTYTAVLEGVLLIKHQVIDAPIKRLGEGMKRGVADDGKHAVSEYFVKDITLSEKSIVDVVLHTGRTHQIRVHMAHIGYPLYADELYGKKVEGENFILHAKSIEFTHPYKKERVKLFAQREFNGV